MKAIITLSLLLASVSAVSGQETMRMPGTEEALVIFQTKPGAPSAPATIQAVPAGVEAKVKVCVTEPKKNDKVVYTSRCKEYCVKECSMFNWFKADCGCDGNCVKHTKNVLVKKKVPGCDTTQCVLKELPAGCVPCAPCSK
jgi:hypothetical protein